MDALGCAALPVFSTRTTEDQHLVPEQGISPESRPGTPFPKDCQWWSPALSLQLGSDPGQAGHCMQRMTCLPVKLLLVLHPHVLSKGVVILVGVPVDDHILADDAGAGTAATRVLHGCHSNPKPATEEGSS